MDEVRQRVAEIRNELDFEKQASDEYALYTDFIDALAEESIYDHRVIARMARAIIVVRDIPLRRQRIL